MLGPRAKCSYFIYTSKCLLADAGKFVDLQGSLGHLKAAFVLEGLAQMHLGSAIMTFPISSFNHLELETSSPLAFYNCRILGYASLMSN